MKKFNKTTLDRIAKMEGAYKIVTISGTGLQLVWPIPEGRTEIETYKYHVAKVATFESRFETKAGVYLLGTKGNIWMSIEFKSKKQY